MLDGGIADSIPLMRARRDGYDRNVVCLRVTGGIGKIFKGLKSHLLFIRNILACARLSTGAVMSTTNCWSWWNGWKMRERLS